MQDKELLALFPQGQIHQQKSENQAYLDLPLSAGRYLRLSEQDLTAREKALLSLIGQGEEDFSDQAWYRYLIDQVGQIPQTCEAVQFVHVHLRQGQAQIESIGEWLDVMQALLPNQVAYFQSSRSDYHFILEQKPRMDIEEVLRDTLQTLEFDLGLQLTIFIGQLWAQGTADQLPSLFRAEQALFLHWLENHHQTDCLTFGQVYLWAGSQQFSEHLMLGKNLRLLMDSQEQLPEIIQALWLEGAVLTKAAQRLYLHRNTLQYRLEKWHDLTGLQLKNLTDLALCYQLLLAD